MTSEPATENIDIAQNCAATTANDDPADGTDPKPGTSALNKPTPVLGVITKLPAKRGRGGPNRQVAKSIAAGAMTQLLAFLSSFNDPKFRNKAQRILNLPELAYHLNDVLLPFLVVYAGTKTHLGNKPGDHRLLRILKILRQFLTAWGSRPLDQLNAGFTGAWFAGRRLTLQTRCAEQDFLTRFVAFHLGVDAALRCFPPFGRGDRLPPILIVRAKLPQTKDLRLLLQGLRHSIVMILIVALLTGTGLTLKRILALTVDDVAIHETGVGVIRVDGRVVAMHHGEEALLAHLRYLAEHQPNQRLLFEGLNPDLVAQRIHKACCQINKVAGAKVLSPSVVMPNRLRMGYLCGLMATGKISQQELRHIMGVKNTKPVLRVYDAVFNESAGNLPARQYLGKFSAGAVETNGLNAVCPACFRTVNGLARYCDGGHLQPNRSLTASEAAMTNILGNIRTFLLNQNATPNQRAAQALALLDQANGD